MVWFGMSWRLAAGGWFGCDGNRAARRGSPGGSPWWAVWAVWARGTRGCRPCRQHSTLVGPPSKRLGLRDAARSQPCTAAHTPYGNTGSAAQQVPRVLSCCRQLVSTRGGPAAKRGTARALPSASPGACARLCTPQLQGRRARPRFPPRTRTRTRTVPHAPRGRWWALTRVRSRLSYSHPSPLAPPFHGMVTSLRSCSCRTDVFAAAPCCRRSW